MKQLKQQLGQQQQRHQKAADKFFSTRQQLKQEHQRTLDEQAQLKNTLETI